MNTSSALQIFLDIVAGIQCKNLENNSDFRTYKTSKSDYWFKTHGDFTR